MFVFTYCYCSLVFLSEAKVYVFETLDLTIFESSINYTWIIFSHHDGIEVLIYSWWCHIVTCFDLTILESSISIIFFEMYFWLLIENQWILWFILKYYKVSQWGLMDIVIIIDTFNCQYRTVVVMIINGCFIVAYGDLMFLLWIIFWYFSSRLYRTVVILWFMISWA